MYNQTGIKLVQNQISLIGIKMKLNWN